MTKRRLMVHTVVALTVAFMWSSLLRAQDSLQVLDDVTFEKKRVLILPTSIDEEDPHSIDKEVVTTIASVAVRLGRFEVIDRNNLRSILAEQDLALLGLLDDSSIVAMGKIAAAREALRVDVLNFSQKGVPPPEPSKDKDNDDDLGLGGAIVLAIVKGVVDIFVSAATAGKEKEEKYQGNIQTSLTAEVRSLDVETGETLYSFYVNAGHTGGTAGKSRSKTMKQFRQLAVKELKQYYILHSQVLERDGNELILLLGSNVGIHRNMVFTISEPDRMEKYGEQDIAIPGRTVGYALVKDVSHDSNRSNIARGWAPIHTGYRADEHTGHVGALQLVFSPPITSTYYGFWLHLTTSVIKTTSLGLEIGTCNLQDSFGNRNTGMKLAVYGGSRIFGAPAYSIEGNIGVSLDIPFRTDDEGETVSTGIGSLILGGKANVLLSEKTDLVFTAGYRFADQADSWNRPGDEGRLPAVWHNGAPRVDISGLFLSIGLQFILRSGI